MKNISILDCTLRDGGYCNHWDFGNKNIKKAINYIAESKVEFLEVGFVTKKVIPDKNTTLYPSLEYASQLFSNNTKYANYVVMINYGEYPIEDIKPYKIGLPIGVRVAFHKKDMCSALRYCQAIKEKGYKVFVQAMVSLAYSENEFIELINHVNDIMPFAFYIVDSFGAMKRDAIDIFVRLTEQYLNPGITLGFHSHNNMQLSFSNAQYFIEKSKHHEIIIDSSVYGMGRGAGNLNTELLIQYLNDYYEKKYMVSPLLLLIDEVLSAFHQQNYWGYSLPYYLSAKYNVHPNYATFFSEKETLTLDGLNCLLMSLSDDKKFTYDAEYAEKLYIEYMGNKCDSECSFATLSATIREKTIVLIAPGHNSVIYQKILNDLSHDSNVCTVGINHAYSFVDTSMIFVSNQRRFAELDASLYPKCIITSNIESETYLVITQYDALLNKGKYVSDNAGLMAIRFFLNLGVKHFLLAGFDGYSYDADMNYSEKDMTLYIKRERIDTMNNSISSILAEYSKEASIEFITPTKYCKSDLK